METENTSETTGSKVVQVAKGLGWKAIAGIAVVTLLVMVGMFLLGGSWKTVPVSGSSSPSITDIQKISELTVIRVKVADVLEESSNEFKGLWVVRGDALIGVDMRLAKVQPVSEETKKLVLLLPQPRVISARVDHDKSKTKTYSVSRKLMSNPFVGDRNEFTDEGMAKAQKIVESQASGKENMKQARDQTELILTNMYAPIGWDIEVVWQGGS